MDFNLAQLRKKLTFTQIVTQKVIGMENCVWYSYVCTK